MTLAERIQSDLLARIRSGRGLPARLSLHGIAALYGVSPMPVRAAVGGLIRKGLLRRAGNGRLELAAGARRRVKPGAACVEPPVALAPDLDAQSAVAAEVFRLSLGGVDVFLREEAAAGRCRLGRTVVRHALGRLAGRGIVQHVPRRGWLVRPFSPDDMRAYLDARETLELKALDLAKSRLVHADLESMLAGNRPESPGRPERLDDDLHAYLIDKAGNRYIREFFERHGSYYAGLFNYAALGAAVTARMAGQHRRILRALLDRDWPAARAALAEHIRAQAPIVARVIEVLRNGNAK